jgi:hypothetical protein
MVSVFEFIGQLFLKTLTSCETIPFFFDLWKNRCSLKDSWRIFSGTCRVGEKPKTDSESAIKINLKLKFQMRTEIFVDQCYQENYHLHIRVCDP